VAAHVCHSVKPHQCIICMCLQVALGLITAKASHIVWPPSRWQRIRSVVFPDRLLMREPSTVMRDELSPSPVELEETLLNDGNRNNCNNSKHKT